MLLFFFHAPDTTVIYTLSLHDALPISWLRREERFDVEENSDFCSSVIAAHPSADNPCHARRAATNSFRPESTTPARSEEHTSELQSPCNLVCRLLLEKKKKTTTHRATI